MLSHVSSHPNFNPRSREGSDLRLFRRHGGDEVISIHAPVKGATRRDYANRWKDAKFQSTLP